MIQIKTNPQDPVTGSAHTVLAPYWATELEKKQLVARQVIVTVTIIVTIIVIVIVTISITNRTSSTSIRTINITNSIRVNCIFYDFSTLLYDCF